MELAQHPVLASLIPVCLLVGAGWLAGRMRWVGPEAVRGLSNLVFMLLIPALLFRTMSAVRFEQLDPRPVLAYFPVALAWLLAQIGWRGFTPRSVVLALGGTFSNNVMIGLILVELAYGKPGLVTLLTLVSVHSLIILTAASVLIELAQARQASQDSAQAPRLLKTVWSAMRASLLHPIPLPIAAGLLFAQTGWSLSPLVDQPLRLLGNAFGPLSLVLVGISLALTPLAGHWRAALPVAACKNLGLPLLVALSGWALGLGGLAWQVIVLAAALPTGANVFLFAQRYRVEQELTTAVVGLSTALGLLTLSAVMLLTAALAGS
ncbi:AEC family transporter [Malikia spinosa]|uniref:AEC family transporter n=1 Tax=Malikia spinosa TaxID=86180 RepID=A0A7C9IXN6_9BURK|nr:AEC family transporter [Malikia spinosa]